MLVSAVVDPSAFDAEYFDKFYTIQAEDFLKGIQRNGLLIVDTENRLRGSLVKRVGAIPIKSRQQLQILVEELFLKKRTRRIIACSATPSDTASGDLLDLACRLKTDTAADALVVGDEGLEKLRSDQRFGRDLVPLYEYGNSKFETDRQRYDRPTGPIDKLPKSEVDDLIIRSIRFAKWLRFYDAYIGTGDRTSHFRRGIEYVLNLWREHGFFAREQGVGSVEIFTRSAEQIRDDETEHAKANKLTRNQESHRKVLRALIEPLKNQFPWPVKLSVKDDLNGIFHARYLEAQHAIIGIERGFDLFKPNGEFQRNSFTLHITHSSQSITHSSHLRECRDLPDADVDSRS